MPYGTVGEADIYHTTAGNTAWSGFDEAVKTAAIFRATWYLDGVYGNRFNGIPAGDKEEWPRTGATDRYGFSIPDDTVPQQIAAATYTAALYDLQNPGVLWPKLDPAQQIKGSSIGPLKKEFFDNNFGDDVILKSVEAMVRRFTTRIVSGPLVIGP